MHHKHLIILLLLLLLTACGRHRQADALLMQADSLMASRPDSAYALLDSVGDEARGTWGRADRMRYELTLAEAMNKAYVNFTTDSVMKRVARYYDRHGSANQQLKAHYLLGCTYRDMGEAPAAINAWQEAVDCADTTSTDCDYKTLYRVYGQMATAFHKRLLFSNEIQSLKEAMSNAQIAEDTLSSLWFQTKIGSAYILLNKPDSAEIIFLEAQAGFERHHYSQQGLLASTPLVYLYLNRQDRMNDVKRLMDRYEALSHDFDEHHELPPSKRQYYSYKGLYYENLGLLDSAEHYYRQVFRPNMDYVSKNPMYKGLLNVFTKRHQADSIAKYARLYCETNDSSIAIKDRETVAHMGSLYNYSRLQRETLEQKARAAKSLTGMIVFIATTIIILMTSVMLWMYFRNQNKRKQEELERAHREFEEAKLAYGKEIRHLQKLEFNHKEVIKLINGELETFKNDSEKYRDKYSAAQHKIREIQERYQEDIKAHQEEIERLKIKVESIHQRTGIGESLETAYEFRYLDIVQTILDNAQRSKFEVTKSDWKTLMQAFGRYYPKLLADLHQIPGINENGIRVCVLITLKLRESDIANILHVGPSSISNYKQDINQALFNENSAQHLFKNLERRYGIFS